MSKALALFLAIVSFSCQAKPEEDKHENVADNKTEENLNTMENKNTETAIFAGGCFWCTEAFFTDVKGVEKVVSGYIGGKTENPTYKEVCGGYTGHAEAIKITFNPEEVAYEDLLEIFFATHDPTTLNRQGADVGTQYRSEVFYTTEAQKIAAEKFIKELGEQNIFDKKIVTKVTAATKFYPAEDYHQDYYAQNPNQPYCQAVISPKLEKLKKHYKSKLKNQ